MKTIHSVSIILGLILGSISCSVTDNQPALDARAPAVSKTLVNINSKGLALEGYDPVAYFTDKKPVQGRPEFTAVHDGATYHFATAAHRNMFIEKPANYAPAYGGYCGYAASIKRLSPIDPTFFQVIDGKLILQHNQKASDKWNADLAGNLVKADSNWPGLVSKNGTAGRGLTNLDAEGVAVGGYDPVSYFTVGKPTPGDPKIEATYNGGLYHFASQENRATFELNPTKYTPAYGGYCGYAASIGKVRPVRPDLWSIVNGKLILQHSKEAVDLWQKDVTGNKTKADRYWPRLVTAKAGKKNPVDSLLGSSILPDVS